MARHGSINDCISFAQFLDVKLFHFWKNLTRGRHLWLRNKCIYNWFTTCRYYISCMCAFVGVWDSSRIFQAIIDGWLFKIMCAFIDTPIFYFLSGYLKKKFNLKINEEVSF